MINGLVHDVLRESAARLRVIFDTVPVGIVIAAAPSGRIVAGNHLAERLFRHPGAAADAVPWAEPEALYPDGRSVPPDEQPLAPALAGEAHAEAEVQYRYADGAQCWVRLIATPLQTGGRITGAVMAILDIDRKMRRTMSRPVARGALSPNAALAFATPSASGNRPISSNSPTGRPSARKPSIFAHAITGGVAGA